MHHDHFSQVVFSGHFAVAAALTVIFVVALIFWATRPPSPPGSF